MNLLVRKARLRGAQVGFCAESWLSSTFCTNFRQKSCEILCSLAKTLCSKTHFGFKSAKRRQISAGIVEYFTDSLPEVCDGIDEHQRSGKIEVARFGMYTIPWMQLRSVIRDLKRQPKLLRRVGAVEYH